MSTCNCVKKRSHRIDLANLWCDQYGEFETIRLYVCDNHPIVCDMCDEVIKTHAVLPHDGVFTCRECCMFTYCKTCCRGYVYGYDNIIGDECKYCIGGQGDIPVYINYSDFAIRINASFGYWMWIDEDNELIYINANLPT